MQYFTAYLFFAAKLFTFTFAVILIFIVLFGLIAKNKASRKSRLIIEKINDRYHDNLETLQETVLSKACFKKWKKSDRVEEKNAEKLTRSRLFVIQFDGDLRASRVNDLREEVTAILQIAQPQDEILVCLESPGGIVHAYGLAASQLERLKAHPLKLTVVVDKIAASGGYLMACIADRILAAPFAVIGSIGVVAQLPNFHRLLKANQVDFEQLTSAQHKRTLTMFGENTPEGRAKMQENIQEIHDLFTQHIGHYRPHLNLKEVATGDYWSGTRALELKLIDDIGTSDDYIWKASQQKDCFLIRHESKKTLLEKIGHTADAAWSKLSTASS